MDVIVRTAIGLGFSPMQALKMATINPADYWGLRHLGAIAPLRYADILFIDDLAKVSIKQVMVNGEMVYADGKFLPKIKPYHYAAAMKKTIKIGKMKEEDFRIKARAFTTPGAHHRDRQPHHNEGISRDTARGFGLSGKRPGSRHNPCCRHTTVTTRRKWARASYAAPASKQGAMATTVIWDTGNPLVVGSSEKDMMVAANRLIDIQGGVVVVKNGKVIYEFPMPVYGLIPAYGMEEIKTKIKALDEKVKEIGSVIRSDRSLRCRAYHSPAFLISG